MSALYDLGRQRFLEGTILWLSQDIRVALIDTGTYTVNLATHEFYSDLSGVVATSGLFSGKNSTTGVADAADITIAAVSGSSVEALVIYKDTGVVSTSPLIAYINAGTGLPFTPNGGDVLISWDNGSSKIFKL
jgi:hypothetical protein